MQLVSRLKMINRDIIRLQKTEHESEYKKRTW